MPPGGSVQQGALELEQRALALEPAGVTDQRAGRADHSVAREDDRHRVAVHDRADGAGGAGPARTLGERPVGRELAVRHPPELLEYGAAELARGTEVDVEVELPARAGEVLVELATDLVGRVRRAQHTRAEDAGETLGLGVRVGVV